MKSLDEQLDLKPGDYLGSDVVILHKVIAIRQGKNGKEYGLVNIKNASEVFWLDIEAMQNEIEQATGVDDVSLYKITAKEYDKRVEAASHLRPGTKLFSGGHRHSDGTVHHDKGYVIDSIYEGVFKIKVTLDLSDIPEDAPADIKQAMAEFRHKSMWLTPEQLVNWNWDLQDESEEA